MTAYKTDQSFHDLYFDFTGYQHPEYPKNRRAIAQDLAAAFAEIDEDQEAGQLVVSNSTGVYVYDDNEGHKLLGGTSFRATDNSGFYEVTGVSHIGPAISYLASLKKLNKDCWLQHVDEMIAHVKEVKEFNSAPIERHWTTQLKNPAWAGREKLIKNMIDYACSLAGNYLVQVKENPEDFCAQHVEDNFLQVSNEDYPIPFNTIMIGTFSVSGFSGTYSIYEVLSNPKIQWANAKVLIHNQAGTNTSAGLTARSNWLHPTILAIAGSELDEDRVIIVPYATVPDSLGSESLPDEDFDYLTQRVWGALYAPTQLTKRVFSDIKDIDIATPPLIPGDYGYTKANQIDDFIMRLKYSMADVTQLLANTVAFWLAGEAAAKNWELDKIDIPGLTTGFPEGISGYPEKSPEIRTTDNKD